MAVSERLRVAFDGTPLLGHRSGVGWFAYEVLRLLPQHVDVSAYPISGRKCDLTPQLPPGVRTHRRPRLPAGIAHRVWAHWNLFPIEGWDGNIDLVHGSNFVVPPARKAARVVTAHDLACDGRPRQLLKKAIDEAAWVHTPTEAIRQEIIDELGADPDRVVTVHLGTRAVEPAELAAGRALAGAEEYVLAIGDLVKRKRISWLVRAFEKVAGRQEHSELHLVIAGAENDDAGAVASAIASLHPDVRRRVRRLSGVSDRQRAQLLRGARVLAHPSKYEGFGLTPLEAMSVDVPVVATECGAVGEVCDDAARLVPLAGSPDDFAAAIDDVLVDETTRNRLIDRGRRRAAMFTWERCATELVERIYRKAAPRSD